MSRSNAVKIDIVIDTLVIEEDRLEHIAKYGVTVEEVLEVVEGDYVFIEGKLGRWLLIGKTQKGRLITIVVGSRQEKNTYGLVTARSASKDERSFYQEFTLQYPNEKES